MKLKSLLFVLFTVIVCSCSVPKEVTYFQGIDNLSQEQLEKMSQNYVSKICNDDRLSITVTAWDPSVVTPFNPPMTSYTTDGESKVDKTQQLHTYLVANDGTINFPVLGKIHVAGLSKQEVADNIKNDISKYVKDAIVNVQIVNYKLTVLGEVLRPGMIEVTNDRISILDALGNAGDLTINANRKNVLVIRDNNGKKEYTRLDLTSPDIFASPCFYLQQNDVVYVEPNEAKKRNARYSQSQQYNITLFSSILSAISVITSLVIAITK